MMTQNLKSTANLSFVVALCVTVLKDVHFLLTPCMSREHLHTEVVVSSKIIREIWSWSQNDFYEKFLSFLYSNIY